MGLFCTLFYQGTKEFYLVWSSPVMTGFSLLRNPVWHKPRQEHRLLPAETGEPFKSVMTVRLTVRGSCRISPFEAKRQPTQSRRVKGGRRRAGISRLLWNLGLSFTLAEGLLMKMKTNPADLEARDMLIHSQISDKTLNQTDALRCQSLKPLELQRWRKKRTILLLSCSNRSIYCTFRYFYTSLGASRRVHYSSIS